jgi:hypothetical protein
VSTAELTNVDVVVPVVRSLLFWDGDVSEIVFEYASHRERAIVL